MSNIYIFTVVEFPAVPVSYAWFVFEAVTQLTMLIQARNVALCLLFSGTFHLKIKVQNVENDTPG